VRSRQTGNQRAVCQEEAPRKWGESNEFRHALIFRVRGDELQVIAVMHQNRRLDYWTARAKG